MTPEGRDAEIERLQARIVELEAELVAAHASAASAAGQMLDVQRKCIDLAARNKMAHDLTLRASSLCISTPILGEEPREWWTLDPAEVRSALGSAPAALTPVLGCICGTSYLEYATECPVHVPDPRPVSDGN